VERRDEEDVGTGTAGAGAGVRRFLMMRPALGVDDGWAAVEVEVEVAAREERILLSCGGSRSRYAIADEDEGVTAGTAGRVSVRWTEAVRKLVGVEATGAARRRIISTWAR
jgi:hypothetical protein